MLLNTILKKIDVIYVTKILSRHPGGKQVILFWPGKDASETFNKFHYMDTLVFT